MNIQDIADIADPRLDDYRNLTDAALRRITEPAGGLYIAESENVIARAIAAGHRPRSVLTQQRWVRKLERLLAGVDGDVPVYVVPDAVAEKVTGFAVHRGEMAAMHRPDLPDLAELIRSEPGSLPDLGRATRSRIAVLEGLTDHANVGSAFRNAAALGIDTVLVSPDCVDPLYRRAVRVSMGTVFQVPWTRIPDWAEGIAAPKAAGYVVAG